MSDTFPIQNGLKQEASSPLPFNFSLEYTITKVQENQEGLKLSVTHHNKILGTYRQDLHKAVVMFKVHVSPKEFG
jgi:hypothetical protein